MSGGVIKQRAATNRGWCVFSLVDLLVIYNTGGLRRTGPAMLNNVQARVVKHVGWLKLRASMSLQECLSLGIYMCVCVCLRGKEWLNVLLTFNISTCRDNVSSETHNHCSRTAGCDITGRALLLSPWLHIHHGQFRFQFMVTAALISLSCLNSLNACLNLFLVLTFNPNKPICGQRSWMKD